VGGYKDYQIVNFFSRSTGIQVMIDDIGTFIFYTILVSLIFTDEKLLPHPVIYFCSFSVTSIFGSKKLRGIISAGH